MYLLDTDLFSLTERKDSHESQRLRFRLSTLQKNELATTIITFEEQMRGWLSWLSQSRTVADQVIRYRKLGKMLMRFRDTNIVDFDVLAQWI